MINKLKRLWWAMRLLVARVKHGDPARKLKIVGVTGTNGKTTTATLLYRIATALGHKSVLISTVEILVSGETVTVPERRKVPGTTPDSVFLVDIFSRALRAGCEYVFMEVSSHAIHQRRVAGIHFTGGIFTNLTHDHLDYHGNLENYFQAKKKFFDRLPRTAFALSNADDPVGEKIVADTRAKKYFYGFKEKPARNATHSVAGGADFTDKPETKLIGSFNAYNTLAVYAAATLLGFDKEKVSGVLREIEPPKGRFEHFLSPTGVLVIVDYAHTPDALENVLTAARGILSPGGKLFALAGCGGDRDPLKRPKMGKVVAMLADIPIFTSDNPRSEDPAKIIAEMQTDLSESESNKVRVVVNRREAIAEAMRLANRGDIILCAGKGHEEYQEVKGQKHHFSDREEFEKLFKMIDKDIFNKNVVFNGVKGLVFIGEKVLVFQRDQGVEFPMQIDLPGGGRENEESPFETFKREVKEEFNLEVREKDVQYAKRYPSVLFKDQFAYFIVVRSNSFKEQDIIWGKEGIDYFLLDPKEFVDLKNGVQRQQKRVADYLVAIHSSIL